MRLALGRALIGRAFWDMLLAASAPRTQVAAGQVWIPGVLFWRAAFGAGSGDGRFAAGARMSQAKGSALRLSRPRGKAAAGKVLRISRLHSAAAMPAAARSAAACICARRWGAPGHCWPG